ncbi:M13 family metallopeptidase [Hutsoniella sourekii]|uniref:M13 family metallopeptidase n=1 Tax=Hutsoniella sourekii TaxID=87650 RepID=UPI0004BC0925|nr:M13-type metalloendopeptidase [Hutsoniella sourekii]
MVNKELIKDDLYLAVNGDWLQTAEIPGDQSTTGGFMDIHQAIEETLMQDVEAMSRGDLDLEDPLLEEFIAYYQLAMDFDRRDQLGAEPVEPYLVRIQQIKTLADFQEFAKEWLYIPFALPFNLGLSPDMKDTQHYAVYLDVPATILPDVTYYEAGNESGKALLGVYAQMTQQVLEAVGYTSSEASQIVESTLAFDRLLVPHLKSSQELADYTKQYNPRSREQVEAYHESLNLVALIDQAVEATVDSIIVTQPDYFQALGQILTEDNLELLKSWLIVKTCLNAASHLSQDLRRLASQYSLALSGNTEIKSPEKQAFYLATGQYDDVIGIYYGKKYFGPQARQDVYEMVETMVNIYKERLQANDWLSQQTIDQAIVKLEALDILVGYPDTYPTVYQQLQVDREASFFDNTVRFARIWAEDNFSKWHKEVDRKKWGMSAATVNAYFNPNLNHICFPAAILQAPFYSLDQTRSQNYGGIGAVIAHEISHAFDNNGAKFDEYGNLSNWWLPEDFHAFQEKAEAVVKQWDGIPFADGQVNGQLTVSENIADGGGLAVALEATKLEADADLAAFFINWARIWRQKARPEYQALLLAVDVHSPAPLRAQIQPQNFEEFHQVFDIQEGDGMYRRPEDRVVIW